MQTCHALFHLGKIVASADIFNLSGADSVDLSLLLDRHVLGDWGRVSEQVLYRNHRALRQKDAFMSVYDYDHYAIRIVTNAQQNCTTISLIDASALDEE